MLLEQTFSELNLGFTNRVTHAHAFAAAHRQCETALCLGDLNYRTDSVPVHGFQVVIKDFGGNFLTHLQCNRLNIHSCCPVLDACDGLQFSEQFCRVVENKKFHPILSD